MWADGRSQPELHPEATQEYLDLGASSFAVVRRADDQDLRYVFNVTVP